MLENKSFNRGLVADLMGLSVSNISPVSFDFSLHVWEMYFSTALRIFQINIVLHYKTTEYKKDVLKTLLCKWKCKKGYINPVEATGEFRIKIHISWAAPLADSVAIAVVTQVKLKLEKFLHQFDFFVVRAVF